MPPSIAQRLAAAACNNRRMLSHAAAPKKAASANANTASEFKNQNQQQSRQQNQRRYHPRLEHQDAFICSSNCSLVRPKRRSLADTSDGQVQRLGIEVGP